MGSNSTGQRLRAWAGGRISRPAGRGPDCELLIGLEADPALAERPIDEDLDRIVNRASGRRLSRTVVGDDRHAQSLTDLFDIGATRAARLTKHLPSDATVLEYDGNVGQLGRAVEAHVDRLVSVDVDPMMKQYGRQLSPAVEFADRDELADDEQFDAAYAVNTFRFLSLDEQRDVLDYVHARLKPGGIFIVDLKLGAATTEPTNDSDTRTVALADFDALTEGLFTTRRVPLFNAGFILRKPSPHDASETPSEVSGRYTADESVVADVLDGEVVVVNLDTGAYYVLQGSAGDVWQMLAGGATPAEVTERAVAASPDDAELVTSWIDDFVQQLLDEQLLRPAIGSFGPTEDVAAITFDPPIDPPVMFRYTDMQFLIQMDPIREYDEAGWPVRRGAQVIRPSE